MTRDLRFYKEGTAWYVDLPDYILDGGTKGDLLMVSGADTWLEKLSRGNPHITLTVSDKKWMVDRIDAVGSKEGPEAGGQWYRTVSEHDLWLCKVAAYLFGKFPATIFYTIKTQYYTRAEFYKAVLYTAEYATTNHDLGSMSKPEFDNWFETTFPMGAD